MTVREKAILELVRLSEEEQRIADIIEQEEAASGNKKNKVFQKYMIKDITSKNNGNSKSVLTSYGKSYPRRKNSPTT